MVTGRPYFLHTQQSTAGLDPPDQSVMTLQTLHWDQPPTDQEIRDLLDIPDDTLLSRYQQSSTSQPSVFTLSEASSLGPSASQVAQPSHHTGTDTTAQRDNEIKRLRQKIRHVSLYSLWAMECYRQLEGRRGQTATGQTTGGRRLPSLAALNTGCGRGLTRQLSMT